MELQDFRNQFKDFVDSTLEARRLAERDRDYKDHKQWTSAEAMILRGRNQAAVVINRIKPKHDFLLGLERQGRTDPKAYPRTPKHEQDAEAVTDALRFVADNADLDETASHVFDNVVCEGYGAAIVEMNEHNEVVPRQIPWDRFYYDPFSRRHDFSDAGYMGITTWMDSETAKATFPKLENTNFVQPEIDDLTFDDKPMWLDRTRPKKPRVRVNEHYFTQPVGPRTKVWHLVFFMGDQILEDPVISPFKSYEHDDKGEPSCPIEAESAFIDRENNRYGAHRGLIHIQDEINHRRSKALHGLSNVTVIADKGAVASATRTMDQLAAGKAFIELTRPDSRFEVDRNTEFASGQLTLLQEAKEEIDAVGVNAALAGDSNESQSGRAIQARQQGGAVELMVLMDQHNHWKKRIYRQIWNRIKQHWTEEKWIRITDDEQNVKFVGLNRPIRGRDVLAEKFGVPPEQVEQALQQQQVSLIPGQLERVVDVENDVAKIDVDIIIDQSPDVVTIQQEQFQTLAELAQAYGPEHVPFEEVLKLSSLRNKDQFLDRTKGGEEQQAALAEQQQQAFAMQEQQAMAELANKVASARKSNVTADQIATETQLALQGLERI